MAYIKRIRKLKEWVGFSTKLREWLIEIEDPKVNSEFIELICEFHKKGDRIQNWNFHEEKMKVYIKFGRYIPSLTSEIRELRIGQIIEEK